MNGARQPRARSRELAGPEQRPTGIVGRGYGSVPSPVPAAAKPPTLPIVIIVTGTAVAAEDNYDRLLAAARAHVERSRTEDGCISHDVFRSVEGPNLLFFERWRDRAALDVHFAQPGSAAFVAELQELVTGDPTLTSVEVAG